MKIEVTLDEAIHEHFSSFLDVYEHNVDQLVFSATLALHLFITSDATPASIVIAKRMGEEQECLLERHKQGLADVCSLTVTIEEKYDARIIEIMEKFACPAEHVITTAFVFFTILQEVYDDFPNGYLATDRSFYAISELLELAPQYYH